MARKLSKLNISTTNTVEAWHVSQSVDALNASSSYDISISGSLTLTSTVPGSQLTGSFTGSFTGGGAVLSGSFSGSYEGDGSNLTGVTTEWDGTLNGDGQITGSLIVTQNITGSIISASGAIYGTTLESYGQNVGVYHAGSTTMRLGDTTQFTKVQGLNIELDAPVTSSYNISSSATIIGKDFLNKGAVGDTHLTGSFTGSFTGDVSLVTVSCSVLTASYGQVGATATPVTIRDDGASTSVGFNSLQNQTGTQYNTAIGYATLRDNTSGQHNVALGHATLPANLDGHYHTALGFSAMSRHSSSDDGNTAIGYKSRYYQRTGQYNVAIGLNANYGGSANTSNTNNYNVMIGTSAGQNLNSGSENTFVGYQTGYDLARGHGNTFIGYRAGYDYNPTSGYGNAYLGWKTCDNMTDGNWNTYLGADQSPSATGGGVYNETAIGAQTAGRGTNKVAIGNTSVTAIEGQVSFTTYSDSRIKRNITSGSLGLDFINSLTPIRFQRVNPAEYPEVIRPFNYFDRTRYKTIEEYPYSSSYIIPADPAPPTDDSWYDGLIAQDVSSSLNNTPSDIWNENEIDGKQGIKYSSLTIPLIKAVQELSAKVTALEAQISGSS